MELSSGYGHTLRADHVVLVGHLEDLAVGARPIVATFDVCSGGRGAAGENPPILDDVPGTSAAVRSDGAKRNRLAGGDEVVRPGNGSALVCRPPSMKNC